MGRTLAAATLFMFLIAPQATRAQGLSEQDKRETFSRAFTDGLRALTERDTEGSERMFKVCIRLYPDRAVPYYNLACTYSVAGKTQAAVEALRECFKRGYRDLAHMSRDPDLDPIRKTPAYRRAVSDFENEVGADLREPLSAEPAGSDRYPLLVFVPDLNDDGGQQLRDLSAAFPSWGVLVPEGVVRDPQSDDNSGEYRLLAVVRRYLSSRRRVDRDRVFVVGEGFAGHLVLTAAANQPDLFTAVVASGPGLGSAVRDVDLEGSRAYLVVHSKSESHILSGIDARNAFAEANCPVVLERYPLPKPLSKDRALLLRALAFLRGEKVTIPGAGKVLDF